MLSLFDPATLDGSPEEVAAGWHECVSDGAEVSNAAFDISSIELSVEHLGQHRIDEDTWGLDTRASTVLDQTNSLTTSDAIIVVTADGIGPLLSHLERDCLVPVAQAGIDLRNYAAETLQVDLPASDNR